MMPILRTVALGLVVLATAACTTPTPSTVEGTPPAFEATSPPPQAPASAYETLKTATVFEDSHIGYGGSLSPNAAAFRAILASPDPKATMRALYTEGTVVGKLYAVAGLYLVDPPAFEPAVRALAKHGGNVKIQQGCMRGEMPVAEVLFASGSRIMIPRGTTIHDYFARNTSGAMSDIAGGFTPLRLASEDDTFVATREPLAP
jgi:hypothetical protein